jgi:hypothetical protein
MGIRFSQSAPVQSVFGRTGAIVATLNDYAAALISAVAHGTTAATTVQGQLDELTDEKVDTSRTISTTAPLTGGGDLSDNRTLAISDFVGDSGSGGTRGAVPAPGAGDAAAGKYLDSDGTWTVPPSGGLSDDDYGDITVGGGGTTMTIDANAVTFAKMQAISADVLLGNDAAGTAVQEIACTAAGRALLDDANAAAQLATLGAAAASHTHALADITDDGALAALNTVGTGQIDDNAVTYAKLQNVTATARLLGRISALAGDAEELTGTQATTLLDAFTDALKGLVPASGGGTTTFLRADGAFATPTATAADPSYSPGSFTVATETGRYIPARLKLTTNQRATVEGTGRLVIS